jgi:hypothetical protein
MTYPALIWDFLIAAIEERDQTIQELEERLDPGNYCEGCGYIESNYALEKRVEEIEQRYHNNISSLEQDLDEERHKRWDAEEAGDKCKRENKRLKGSIW